MTFLDPILQRTGATAFGKAPERPPERSSAAPQALSGSARQVAFLVNGDKYFRTLAEVLSKARRSIWIVGWDFNPDILLAPGTNEQTLGDLLKSVARANPAIEIRILVWALGPLYSQKSLALSGERDFADDPQIRLHFARHIAWRGCHHQKLVCIDDDVAFIGGIDLTSRRWDTAEHNPHDERRRAPTGKIYEPLHDVQAMVTGDAARSAGVIVRRRWADATGEHHFLPPPLADHEELETTAQSMKNVPVRFVLTEPSARFRRAVNDGLALTLDIIRTAEKHLYIETQYLASVRVAKALAERLTEPSGPEIVIVCTRSSHGFIEKLIMGKNRRRMVRRLKQADRYGRLRVFYPVVPNGEGETEILIHAKLLIADDRRVRIGSSNLNYRSEGLDTECDMLLEAERPIHRRTVANLRNQLLAEHLGVDDRTIAEAVRRSGSLVKAIDELNVMPRGLRRLDADIGPGSIQPVTGTNIFDPARPFSSRRHLRVLARRLLTLLSLR